MKRKNASRGVGPATSARTIDLSANDGAAFWQLRARIADVQRAEQAATAAAQAIRITRGALSGLLAGIAKQHGFDVARNQLQLDEAQLSLHLTPEKNT